MTSQGRRVLGGHPWHPAVTHFPIALWGTSTLWDGIALWRGEVFWWQMAFWCLVAGWVAAIPAMALGLVDSMAVPEDEAPERALKLHIVAVLSAAAAYGGACLLHRGDFPPTGIKLVAVLLLSGLGLLSLLVGGWFGAELVYRFDLGRSRRSDS